MLYRGHGPVNLGVLLVSLAGLALPVHTVTADSVSAAHHAAVGTGTPTLLSLAQSKNPLAASAKKSSVTVSANPKAKLATKSSSKTNAGREAGSAKKPTSSLNSKPTNAGAATSKSTSASKSAATSRLSAAPKVSPAPKVDKTLKLKSPKPSAPPAAPGAGKPTQATAPSSATQQSTAQGAGTNQGESTPVAITSPATQPPTPFHILYNEKPSDSFTAPDVGAQMYFGVYQNTDPNATSGQIDVPRVLAATRLIVAANPNMEWGMLDFEHPYNEVLLAGPSDPLYAGAVASKIALIKAVKEEFPNIKWTYYGVPRLPYWADGHSWSTMTETKRRELFDHAQASYGPIMQELDWVQPTVYDKYERNMGFPLSNVEARDNAERSYRMALVEVVRDWYSRNGLSAKPILPAVSPWFLDASKATMFRAIPSTEMESDQLRSVIEAGAQGVSVWSGMRHKIMLATINFMPNSEFGQLSQSQARSTFASDVLGGASLSSINWQDPAVKDALERACNEAMATMMGLAQKINARHREALANAGGGES
jgi:hypothetical protein